MYSERRELVHKKCHIVQGLVLVKHGKVLFVGGGNEVLDLGQNGGECSLFTF